MDVAEQPQQHAEVPSRVPADHKTPGVSHPSKKQRDVSASPYTGQQSTVTSPAVSDDGDDPSLKRKLEFLTPQKSEADDVDANAADQAIKNEPVQINLPESSKSGNATEITNAAPSSSSATEDEISIKEFGNTEDILSQVKPSHKPAEDPSSISESASSELNDCPEEQEQEVTHETVSHIKDEAAKTNPDAVTENPVKSMLVTLSMPTKSAVQGRKPRTLKVRSSKKTERQQSHGPGSPPRRSGRQKGLTERQQLALAMKQSEDDAMLIDVSKRNASGETPLHQVVIKGDHEMAVKIVAQGASVNVKDYAGWTPLHEACNHGYVEITKLLIKHGAEVSAPGCDSDTPLHDAAVNSHTEIVRMLIEAGAQVNAKNRYNDTPYDVASDPAVKAILVNAGAQCSSPDVRQTHPVNVESGRQLHNASVPRTQYANSVVDSKLKTQAHSETQEKKPDDTVEPSMTTPAASATSTKLSKPSIIHIDRDAGSKRGNSAFGKAIANSRLARSQGQQSGKRVRKQQLHSSTTGPDKHGRKSIEADTTNEMKDLSKGEILKNSEPATHEMAPASKSTIKPMKQLAKDTLSSPGTRRKRQKVTRSSAPSTGPRESSRLSVSSNNSGNSTPIRKTAGSYSLWAMSAVQTHTESLDLLDRYFGATKSFDLKELENCLKSVNPEMVPDTVPDMIRKLYVEQVSAKYSLEIKMAYELNRIRASFDRELQRSSMLYRCWREKVSAADPSGTLNPTMIGRGDLNVRHEYAMSVAEASARHACEAAALSAVQFLEWPLNMQKLYSQLIPKIDVPHIVVP